MIISIYKHINDEEYDEALQMIENMDYKDRCLEYTPLKGYILHKKKDPLGIYILKQFLNKHFNESVGWQYYGFLEIEDDNYPQAYNLLKIAYACNNVSTMTIKKLCLLSLHQRDFEGFKKYSKYMSRINHSYMSHYKFSKILLKEENSQENSFIRIDEDNIFSKQFTLNLTTDPNESNKIIRNKSFYHSIINEEIKNEEKRTEEAHKERYRILFSENREQYLQEIHNLIIKKEYDQLYYLLDTYTIKRFIEIQWLDIFYLLYENLVEDGYCILGVKIAMIMNEIIKEEEIIDFYYIQLYFSNKEYNKLYTVLEGKKHQRVNAPLHYEEESDYCVCNKQKIKIMDLFNMLQ
ncbi:hypothetical protein SLOPH_2302 [Spraguea lophii 42_110]|uniref:Uncharacterized protein n=1 Tax=Spraguea lophii (strain 42_110) TaxID=1358809 RepID=S7W7Q6_SPRLO|nr:hypothetical protein SLOPH_2302 [Spraguea lophii 42_110]